MCEPLKASHAASDYIAVLFTPGKKTFAVKGNSGAARYFTNDQPAFCGVRRVSTDA